MNTTERANPTMDLTAQPLPGAVAARIAQVTGAEMRAWCDRVRGDGGRIVALWGCDDTDLGSGYALNVALLDREGLVCLRLPLPAEHPFWRHPKVTVLPHVAALTDERSAAAVVAGNLEALARGEALANLVDRARGY